MENLIRFKEGDTIIVTEKATGAAKVYRRGESEFWYENNDAWFGGMVHDDNVKQALEEGHEKYEFTYTHAEEAGQAS